MISRRFGNPRHPLCGTFALLILTPCVLADWSQWRGSDRNGVDPNSPPLMDQLPEDGLQPVWTSGPIGSGTNGGWSSPVIHKGRVYLFAHDREQLKDRPQLRYPNLTDDQKAMLSDEELEEYETNRREEQTRVHRDIYAFREPVYCFDLATGELLWENVSSSVYSRWPQSGSPTVDKGRLYLLGAGRQARCIDAGTGEDVWTRELPGEYQDEFYQSSPLLAGDAVVFVAGRLFGLNPGFGEILWETNDEQTSGTHSSPVAWANGEQTCVVANLSGGWTGCFDSLSGHELWRVKTEGGAATPLVVGDRLITYGNSREKGLRCFLMEKDGARELWQFHGTQDRGSSPVVVENCVIVQGERRIACVDLETGKAHWQGHLDLESPQYTSLLAADGKVIYAFDGITIFPATPDGFDLLINAKINSAGLMAPLSTHRTLLSLDEIEKQEGGLEKSTRILQQELGRHGPLRCATPAISGGLLVIRTPSGLACYDLRKGPDVVERKNDRQSDRPPASADRSRSLTR